MEQLEELQEAEKALTQHATDLLSEWDKPLKVNERGFITQGVYFIDADFTTNFWAKARKKPKPTKCVCAQYGQKHNLKA